MSRGVLELLPRSLACLTDCGELVTQLLTPDVVRLLGHLEAAGQVQGEGAAARSGVVQLIHISDQNTNSGFGPNDVPERALRRFSMRRLGPSGEAAAASDAAATSRPFPLSLAEEGEGVEAVTAAV